MNIISEYNEYSLKLSKLIDKFHANSNLLMLLVGSLLVKEQISIDHVNCFEAFCINNYKKVIDDVKSGIIGIDGNNTFGMITTNLEEEIDELSRNSQSGLLMIEIEEAKKLLLTYNDIAAKTDLVNIMSAYEFLLSILPPTYHFEEIEGIVLGEFIDSSLTEEDKNEESNSNNRDIDAAVNYIKYLNQLLIEKNIHISSNDKKNTSINLLRLDFYSFLYQGKLHELINNSVCWVISYIRNAIDNDLITENIELERLLFKIENCDYIDVSKNAIEALIELEYPEEKVEIRNIVNHIKEDENNNYPRKYPINLN